MTIEELKECKSYADAIRLIFNKDYTNGKIQEKARQWCKDNFDFDLEQHIQDYKNRKTYCLNCGKELTGEDRLRKKFCCSSCAATYNNKQRGSKTEDEKKKISESLLKRNAKEKGIELEEYLSISRRKDGKHLKYKCICVTCGSEFWAKSKDAKHCSHKCSNADPEVKQKMRDKVKERIQNGTFSGWQSRNITSYPEQFWINVLNEHNISYIREDFSTKKYFIDFLIEKNKYKIDLEIDGKQHKYEDRMKHDKERDEYLTNAGFTVYRIDWNEINSEKGKEIMKQKINAFLEWYNNL